MTTRSRTIATIVLGIVLCGFPDTARADYLFVPFIGGAFAGKTSFLNLEQGAGSTQLVLGGSAGWLTTGLIGFEGEFVYAPRFFERDNLAGVIAGSNVVTLSGSVILAVPQQFTGYSMRPYVVGGLGLIHSSIDYDNVLPTVADNSPGFNLGAGAIGFLTPRTGVRFELRHFRTLDRQASDADAAVLPRLSFWRFSVGVVIRR